MAEKFAFKINFVSIAWNDRKTDWEQRAWSRSQTGVPLYSANKGAEFFTFYQVSSTTRFILVDPESKIIELIAKQASAPLLAIQFEYLLDHQLNDQYISSRNADKWITVYTRPQL